MDQFIYRHFRLHIESIRCRFLGNPSETIQGEPHKFWPVSVYGTWWKMSLFTSLHTCFLFILRVAFYLRAISSIIHPLYFCFCCSQTEVNAGRQILTADIFKETNELDDTTRRRWEKWISSERKRNKKIKDNTVY